MTVTGEAASCSAVLVNGIGNCRLILDEPGGYNLTVSYSGDRYFLPSSATLTHTVVPPISFYLPMVSGAN